MKRPAPISLLLLPLLTCLLAAAGCGLFAGGERDGSPDDSDVSSDDSDGPSDQPLAGVVWELEAIENARGEVIFRPEPEQTYRVTFDESGSLTAQNACNVCEGQYETAGSSISIAASCTEAACGIPSPYLGYGDALNHAVEYEIVGSELRIRSVDREGNEQTLVHVPEQE